MLQKSSIKSTARRTEIVSRFTVPMFFDLMRWANLSLSTTDFEIEYENGAKVTQQRNEVAGWELYSVHYKNEFIGTVMIVDYRSGNSDQTFTCADDLEKVKDPFSAANLAKAKQSRQLLKKKQ